MRKSNIHAALPASALSLQCDPGQFDFKTTADLADLSDFIGQPRALEALRFGVSIKHTGYNLYALGPAGYGKHTVVRSILEQEAMRHSPPSDWCYVYNFAEPQKPLALQLPAGWGVTLRDDMENLIEELTTTIPAIFDSEEYRGRLQKIADSFNKKQEGMFKELEAEAKKQDMAILGARGGFIVVPVKDGKTLTAEDFDKLSEEERKQKEKIIAELTEQVTQFLKNIPRLHKERREKEKEIQNEFTMAVVGHFIAELKTKYADQSAVVSYLNAVEQDIINNVKDFFKPEEGVQILISSPTPKTPLTRYQINVLVDNTNMKGLPVIYEDNPTFFNLMGRIEHIAQFGTLVTDFTLIKPGVLHRANGGYLMLNILKVLMQPFAWDALKRALLANRITIEIPGQLMGFVSTVSIEPEKIPLKIKVVLLGDRRFYYLLCNLDPDFCELFKVAADFEEKIVRDSANTQLYAQLIATLARKQKLRPLNRFAVARVIDYSARSVEDAERLSTSMREVIDLLHQADYWAELSDRKIIEAADVQHAIDSRIYRLDRVRENVQEGIQRNFLFIDTRGKKVGQINALSVTKLGEFFFGFPSRITARVHSGKGDVIDIQREIKKSGPNHSKGVLIMAGFFNGRYTGERPLSLSASLVFEQTYGKVEGDSASVAELCALLSALAEIPIKQNLAITGSVNQHGQIQPIGGVNEKIEGFFDVCKLTGLTGDQGVIIPKANVKNLMLRKDVVEAAEKHQFHIYPIENVDQAIFLLTGVPAGEKDKKGNFSEGSINQLIDQRLQELAKVSRKKLLPKKIRKK